MKTRAIAVTVTLLFFLSLSFTIVAEAVEIKYDDGYSNSGYGIAMNYKVGVRFTKEDLLYSQNLLNSVNIYAYADNSGKQLQMRS